MKKSQMEMMGLAVVVVLIVLGLLFAMRMTMSKNQGATQPRDEFVASEYAANFLNTMLETNAPACNDASFSKLYIDCADNFGTGGKIMCGTNTSCEYLNQTTRILLNDTLGQWRVSYTFIATRNSNNNPDWEIDRLFNPIHSNVSWANTCESNPNSKKPKIQPLPTNGNPIHLWLYICQ